MSERKTMCIYHGNCADGFGAAWAVRKALGDTVEFVAAKHGDAPPDVTNLGVIIVDFSYKRDALAEMGKVANSILVLDHHKTAQADLDCFDPFEAGVRTDRTDFPGAPKQLGW